MKISVYSVTKESQASYIFDFIRFIAAFLVVIFHGGIELSPGYESVMLFFVLSGLFISPNVIKLISEDRWSWKSYIINRLSRLWLVLIPALILAFMWVKVRIGLFGGEERFVNVLDLKVFFANVFFLQSVTSPVYGSNGPLWSLSFEFWYYMLFPCIIHVIYAKNISKKIVYLIISIGISCFVGKTIMQYFPIWLLGSLIVIVKPKLVNGVLKRRVAIFFAILVSFVSINLMYIFYRSNHTNGYQYQLLIDYIVGVSCAYLFYVIISLYNNKKCNGDRIMKIFKYLAGFSYTLYLTHYPLLQFIRDYTLSPYLKVSKLILMPITLIFVVLYAWLVSLITEAHTDKFRKILNRFVNTLQDIIFFKFIKNSNDRVKSQ